jgi:hypothetical protein
MLNTGATAGAAGDLPSIYWHHGGPLETRAWQKCGAPETPRCVSGVAQDECLDARCRPIVTLSEGGGGAMPSKQLGRTGRRG